MKWLKMTVGTVTFVLPVTITVLDTFGYVAKVEGASMQPVLNPDGRKSADYVFLNKWSAKSNEFSRGEVVALTCPSNPEQKLIKRIIAVEGDHVTTLGYKEKFVKIPSGHCWVEGDHHKHSMDSNFFGPVSQGLITAKASYIVWPPRRWRRITMETVEEKRLKETQFSCSDS